MVNITKHDSEQKWEGHACKYCWIHLFVEGYAIGINNELEGRSKFVSFEKRWFFQSWNIIWAFLHIQTLESMHFNDVGDDLSEVEGLWAPYQSLRHHSVLLQHVQVNVDCFFSLYKHLVDLENRDICSTFLVNSQKELPKCHFGISNQSLRVLFNCVAAHQFFVKGFKLHIKF
jgi:hypothetical protein